MLKRLHTSTTPGFADLLRRYRRNAGLSQRELARRAGYSADYVSMLERGVRAPGTGTLAPLLEALELDNAERQDLERATWSSRPSPAAFNPARLTSVSPLIHRESELAEIEAFLDGNSPALLVIGESGIGKSRLLEAARRLALERGITTLTSNWGSHPTDAAHGYAPILPAISAFVHAQPRRVLRTVLQGCEWLTTLLPEVVDMGGSLPEQHIPPDQERRQAFHAVARFLGQSAGPSGCLLVLDELQSARADGVELLRFLLSTQTRVRLVGAYRSGEVLPTHPFSGLIDDLLHRDDLRTIHPRPLHDDAARQLILNLLPAGHEHDKRVDAAVSLSDGVPLYLVCFARTLREELLAGSASNGFAGALPEDLVVLVQHQLARLPKMSRDLLRVVAVSPWARVSRTQLAERFGHDDAKLQAGLDQLIRRHLLCEFDTDVLTVHHEVVRLVAAGINRRLTPD